MKNFVIIFSVLIALISCNKDEDNGLMGREKKFVGIEGITFENFPKLDGSTSAREFNTMVACKLLNIRYQWHEGIIGLEWILSPHSEDIPEKYRNFFYERVITSQTHGAFMNLINGNADIILTHRTISSDEKSHAESVGVSLIEMPIALDAFVFVVNKSNPVKSLTIKQIQRIYTGEIANWSEVGGNNANITVYTRPRNSGSEEVMREIVMDGLEPADFPAAIINPMYMVFTQISGNPNSICYTFNNYKEKQARKPDSEVPKIAINGIFPAENTIKKGTYPFISKLYIAIRSNLDSSTMAYKLFEWLQSEHAKYTISECGFILK